MPETILLNHSEIQQKISRMSFELLERNIEAKSIVFIGIGNNGSALAELLVLETKQHTKQNIHSGSINLNAQSHKNTPVIELENISLLNKSSVVLVDDVMNSGKTFMWACAHLIQYPIDKLITAVLVERKHRTFPIKADVVGLKLSTTLQEHVYVQLKDKTHVVTMK
jgi:pyrimidine operon attenuation protein/uracil phosphoribosyltransferase